VGPHGDTSERPSLSHPKNPLSRAWNSSHTAPLLPHRRALLPYVILRPRAAGPTPPPLDLPLSRQSIQCRLVYHICPSTAGKIRWNQRDLRHGFHLGKHCFHWWIHDGQHLSVNRWCLTNCLDFRLGLIQCAGLSAGG
jgi:hypothetical protein